MNIMNIEWNKNMSVDEIARVAIEGEKEAIVLYARAEMLCERPRSKLLYRQLMRMERGHLNLLSKRFDIEAEPPSDEEIKKADFEDMKNEDDILRYAMMEEKKATKLYKKGLELAIKRKIKDVFKQLIADEQYHYDLLKGLYVQLHSKLPDV